MRWLIVEDALQDRTGHWFESIRTFRDGLVALGDDVSLLVSKKAAPFIVDELNARPVLPPSIWHRMSDDVGVIGRYFRVPWHAFQTWRTVRSELKADSQYDIIFVPTVSVHHLVGWAWLIKGPLGNSRARVLLYFLSTPIRIQSDGNPEWIKSPTTRLMARLLGSMCKEIERGKVIIGVETIPLREAFSRVAGIPVRYLPQPVAVFAKGAGKKNDELLFGCFGPARHEKGSDVLMAAIDVFLQKYSDAQTKFAVQWLEDFSLPDGKISGIPRALRQNPRVEIIRHFFRDGEYASWLEHTDVVILPYRLSSYGLRGSRVLIEAMVHGIPVVATRGSILAKQAEEFGAAVLCEDENIESLVGAIRQMEQNYDVLRSLAQAKMQAAREHFSVREFRQALLCGIENPSLTEV
jgi:glycosyltransferase involved in cell wall biosynthesis